MLDRVTVGVERDASVAGVVSVPVKLCRPAIASRVRTLTLRPTKRRKCSGLVSGRSAPGEETSSE